MVSSDVRVVLPAMTEADMDSAKQEKLIVQADASEWFHFCYSLEHC